jgi:hypothetical protein
VAIEFDESLAGEATVIDPVAPDKPKKGTRTRKNTTKAKREERSESIERVLAWGFAALVGWYYTVQDMPEECEPTEEEAYGIVRPLVHILDRHAGDLPEIADDYIDAGMFVVSLLIYARRVTKVVQQNKRQRELEKNLSFTIPIDPAQNGYSTHQPEASYPVQDDSPVRKTRKKKTNDVSSLETHPDEPGERSREQSGAEQSDDPIADLLRRDAEARSRGDY